MENMVLIDVDLWWLYTAEQAIISTKKFKPIEKCLFKAKASNISMEVIFMNTENSKTNEPHKAWVSMLFLKTCLFITRYLQNNNTKATREVTIKQFLKKMLTHEIKRQRLETILDLGHTY